MTQIHGFDFFPLAFNRDGKLENPAQFAEFKQHAAQATDAVMIAHGFRNNEQDATGWYTEFLKNFRAHLNRPEFNGSLENRKWIIGGVYWPSKSLPEGPSNDEGEAKSLGENETAQREFIRAQLLDLKCDVPESERGKIDEAIAMLSDLPNDIEKQDQFVDKLLTAVEGETLDPNEGLEFLRGIDGHKVLESMSARRRRRPRADDDDDAEGGGGGVMAVGGTAAAGAEEEGAAQGLGSFFGGVFGQVGKLINLSTWYIMKERSGLVGSTGVAQAVRELKKAHNVKVHLVGHSLGGRLMAACAKSLGESPIVQPDSVTLLQAAFSHYGFSKAKDPRGEGFFRSVIDKKVVKGPMVATFSAMDSVVGSVYAVASMLRGDNTKKLGDKDSQFGGIGANGAQEMDEVFSEALHPVGTPYTSFSKKGTVVCLDGSKNLITSHGDITNPNVTYVFASAVALT